MQLEKFLNFFSEVNSDYIFKLNKKSENNLHLEFISDNYYTYTNSKKNEIGISYFEWLQTFDNEYNKKITDFFNQALTIKSASDLICRCSNVNNKPAWVKITAKSEWNNTEEQCITIWGLVKDITEQINTEETTQLKTMFLEAIAHSSIDGILVVNNRGEKILQNNRVNELWKIPKHIVEDVEGIKQVQHVMHMTKNPKQFVGNIDYLREHPNEICGDELELIDGTILERYSSPVLDRTGKNYGRVWIFHDITNRKKKENKIETLLKEKELILIEVHHRIKNNMNTLLSILKLQTNTLQEPSALHALQDTENRIRSMMVLYDKLYQSLDFNEMFISTYLNELIDQIIMNFPCDKSIKVEKNIQDFNLTSKQLSSIGILVNELLTNIMKYAFNDRDNGQIIINASIDNNLVSIIIQDDGVGFPDEVNFENSSGFGFTLVKMLALQLNATLHLEHKNGTKIILEFEK